MQTITKRELNQHTAAALDRVTDTNDLVVTERGRPRWRISTAHEQESVLERLAREGRYTPPAPAPAPWPIDSGDRSYSDAEVDALLDELRGDH